ncbi:MAG: hypothetical protein O3A00_24015, partial [Planctomycetota bacterium]|nr:hypothetical protein [Planctomycetota bacterium]
MSRVPLGWGGSSRLIRVVTFRGQAYVFQIWRAVDFGFITNVKPPNLKAVSLTPKSSIRVFLERSSIRHI